VQGLLAIGLVGALFAPDCALFLLRGDAWWARVAAAFPAQQVCSLAPNRDPHDTRSGTNAPSLIEI
jgi:hypothetical protein